MAGMQRDERKDSLKCEVSSLKTSNFKLHTSNCPRGFTFLELLATMVLISVLLPVVMQTISLCTQLAGQSRRQMEAVCLAKTKLTELTATQDWQNGNSRGDFGTDWPGYEWTTTIANWTDASVRQLDLTVTWRSVGRQRQLTLSTLVYPQEQ